MPGLACVTLPTRISKTLSKCISSLVLELLVCLTFVPKGGLWCHKWQWDFREFSSHKIWTQGPVWMNFVANERSQIEHYHKNSFKWSGELTFCYRSPKVPKRQPYILGAIDGPQIFYLQGTFFQFLSSFIKNSSWRCPRLTKWSKLIENIMYK